MNRYRNRSLGWVFVSRMIGIICFLIIVVLANILTFYVANPTYHSAVNLINGNFWLLILIAVILLIADITGAFEFPLNLPAPLIKAIGSVFLIAFILRVFEWVDSIASMNIYPSFWLVSFLVVPLVFLLVMAVGYIEIIRRLWCRPDSQNESVPAVVVPRVPEGERVQATDAKSWDEIGAEFRMMLYDIVHRFRQEIKKKQ